MLETSARLLRLLSVLQIRRFWTGAELANRLEVTPRTLRRDVDRLRSLGYTVDATSGPGGGYQLGTGTDVPPLLLNDAEAVAVSVALRGAADVFAGIGEAAMSAWVKLDQLLPPRLQKRVRALGAATMSLGNVTSRVDADVLTALATACRDRVAVSFEYQTHDGATKRRSVEPLRLVHSGNRRWYLVAWDQGRAAWRTFRVDRIAGRVVAGDRFAARTPPDDLESFVSDAIAASPYRYRVRARLTGTKAELTAQIPPWCGVLDDDEDGRCTLLTGGNTFDAVVCQLVMAGVDFELVDAPEFAAHLRAIADRFVRGADSMSKSP